MRRVSHVLVIDDEVAMRKCIGHLLGCFGDFRVLEAEDGAMGVLAATAFKPDLILLDLKMPGMSGYEVCAALREDPRTREIPIIVLSAAEESSAMVSALEAGADDFLRKPFYADELRAKIRTITRLNRYHALAAERDRFRWLLNHSLEPLIIAGAGGTLIYANAPARELFQLGSETGIDVTAAIGKHFRAEPAEAWAAWREMRWPPGESFALFQPGTPQVAARWLEVEVHALDAEATQTLLKFTNRTGLVRHEIETFAFQHLIAHKIRTPLNGLGPVLSLLAAREPRDADEAEATRHARQCAERLERTLLGILNYHTALFSAASGGADVTAEPWPAILGRAAEATGLSDRLNVDAPAMLVARPELLEVVLTELLENYAKFSDARTTGLRIALEKRGKLWELRFSARGPALPPDVVAQLGRPYKQLEKRFTGEVPGVGLGLATVRLLLRSIGGEILFANGEETPGVVTTVQLPPGMFAPEVDAATAESAVKSGA